MVKKLDEVDALVRNKKPSINHTASINHIQPMLFQSWHDLGTPQLEKQLAHDLSLEHFVGLRLSKEFPFF